MSETNEAGGKHYGKGLQPWDLQRYMKSWGSVFIDARRTDAQEYLFRKKGPLEKQLDDAKKALHNVQVIIEELEKMLQPESESGCAINHTIENLHLENNGSCSVCGNPWPENQYLNRPVEIAKHIVVTDNNNSPYDPNDVGQ